MIAIEKFTLDNGLRVLVHTDNSTPIVSFNMLYNVGSRDEEPDKTGFAHLFEHLMFGGSINIPSFDEPLERVGAENNAFTSNDITNYYITVPKPNLETAFWMESDRMLSLAFSKKSLDTQKKVVVEEFNQRYLNQPYGDVWLLLRPLAYKHHPYQWPTIGKSVDHIKNATLDYVKEFFFKHYAPNNAILCVAGPVSKEEIYQLSNKWFGPIERRDVIARNLPKEPTQTEPRRLEVVRDVPYDAIYKAFHMCNRNHPDFHTYDLMSDLLSNGRSARLFQRLVKELGLFSDVNAFITGDIDDGLFVITGRLVKGTTFEQGEAAIDEELGLLTSEPISEYELEKVKNKFESNFTFGETSPLDKAMNLCFFELVSQAEDINQEVVKYRSVSAQRVMEVANELFRPENSSTLLIKAKN
ncbi:MAG TPA: pitrilysin family protein [Tenuifilaceae bacterium]|nr:pitrilysin family protein [Tenuifilaceae bacterium]HQB76949.1 pitrilysin family protein [Tenuifilaceae bacterium]